MLFPRIMDWVYTLYLIPCTLYLCPRLMDWVFVSLVLQHAGVNNLCPYSSTIPVHYPETILLMCRNILVNTVCVFSPLNLVHATYLSQHLAQPFHSLLSLKVLSGLGDRPSPIMSGATTAQRTSLDLHEPANPALRALQPLIYSTPAPPASHPTTYSIPAQPSAGLRHILDLAVYEVMR